VVEGFLERPLLVGVFVHADDNIGNLCVVADMPAYTLLALQHETGVSVGLVLCHQDNGLLEAVLGGRRGPGLVELCKSLVHKAYLILTSQDLCVPDQEPVVYVLTTPSLWVATRPLGNRMVRSNLRPLTLVMRTWIVVSSYDFW
jgi:hypothetical protein